MTSWRTGANEPTPLPQLTTINIGGKSLPSEVSFVGLSREGDWSLYSIVKVEEWGVYILSGGKETTRNSQKQDVVKLNVPGPTIAQTIRKVSP